MTTPADTAHRYPVTAKHPPLRVRVLVMWNGRTFKASRVYHPRTKKLCWVTIRTSDFSEMYLPPKGRKAQTWGDNPDYWQPEKPDAWQAPLPAPLRLNGASAEGVMADVGKGARRRRRAVLDELADILPWWWMVDPDTPRIAYEAPGAVTRENCEGRLMRAVSASGAGETARLFRGPENAQVFQELSERAQAIIRNAASEMEKVPPSRWLAHLHLDKEDLDDWLTAMSWFAALNPPDLRRVEMGEGDDRYDARRNWSLNDRQKVLVARARCVGGPISWRTLGEMLGISHVRCMELYESAIDRALRAANGLHVVHDHPVDHLAAVRESNRAFKRGTASA